MQSCFPSTVYLLQTLVLSASKLYALFLKKEKNKVLAGSVLNFSTL